ncbi:ATP-binding protein [Tunturiibacter psychrotolerans]|uniref:ATP-binding protein n=1 Tax=Tunturiibacter psychrotolerans TaxID=3069686 RepID=UPI003D19C30B
MNVNVGIEPEVLIQFAKLSGLKNPDFEVKPRPNGNAIVIRIAEPSERFFQAALDISAAAESSGITSITVKKGIPKNRIQSPEARYFLRVLSESLNINRFSFGNEFVARYTRSVSHAEDQILARANHVVYGRRGAGKSSLLLYAMRSRQEIEEISVWIDMQVFEKRHDSAVAIDVFLEVFRQLAEIVQLNPIAQSVESELKRVRGEGQHDEQKLRMMLPSIRGALASIGPMFIFLDDFHVLDIEAQPKLLGLIYSVTRGNNIYLKLSAIETLTRTWNNPEHAGLQIPQDAQTIRLDYNLTMPERASEHIEGILDAHAKYCGLPSVKFLCNSPDVLARLVWVSAGVPRDALNMFTQAITKATALNRGRVTVSDVNMATSEMVSQKMRELDVDLAGSSDRPSISEVLEEVKDFCVKQHKKNAFLVEIRNSENLYRDVLKLVDLRLLHVISEGVTVGEAGRKYLALILDYGLYTGVRAAPSVDLFNKTMQRVSRKELRTLPILKSS